jgi:DNA-binding Lrp family transcriptional regulator
MDKLDSQILRELQHDFPLSENPYEVIADRLQIPKEQLWHRVRAMLDNGVIRRIGVSFDSQKLGFCSTLAAVSVGPELVDRASEIISRFHEVTHSYLRGDPISQGPYFAERPQNGNRPEDRKTGTRDDVYNIWFTLIAADNDRIESILEQIRESLCLGRSDVLNLPVKRLFKLDARFHTP